MVVNVQIEGAPKTLDQRDSASPCRGFGVTGFAGQMRGNDAIDDSEHLAHDGRLAGKQKAQRERHTEHPLAHGLIRQDFVYQQGGTVHHSARTATAAKSASLATERHGPLIMAGLAPDP
jgi:hypothetical protein